MNSDNNLNDNKIQPITGDNKDIENSINNNSTPTPLQPINVEENATQVVSSVTPVEEVPVNQSVSPTPALEVVANTNTQTSTQVQQNGALTQASLPGQENVINPQAPVAANTQNTTVQTPTPVQNIAMQPNGVMPNEAVEQIQSITTGTVNNSSINNAFDQNNNINFVSTGKELKKKKNPVVVTVIVAIVVIIVGVFGYFIGYPFIMKTFFNKPKDAFKEGINNVSTLANTIVDDTVHDTGTVDIKLTLDTNIEALKQFSGYTYGIKTGIDPYSSSVEMGYSVYNVNTKEEFSEYYYLKKDSYYKRYSTYRDLLYLTDIGNSSIESLFYTLTKNRNQITKLNNNDAKYIVSKISSSLISSLNEDKLTKEETNIIVNNNTIKATRHKYVMDSTTLNSTKKTIIDDLTSDEDATNILANILDVNSNEVSNKLNNLLDLDDATLTISIITTLNKLNIIGYEINYNDQVIINYYNDNGNFTINAQINDKKVNVIGIKGENVTEVSINIDDEDKAKLIVSSWSDTEKVFDYSIIDQEGKTITGTFKYTKNNSGKDLKSLIELSVKNDDIYLNATLDINYDWTNEVANINTTAAKNISDEELEQIDVTFLQYLKNTPLGTFFKTIGGDTDPSINDYYGDEYNVDDELIDDVENIDEFTDIEEIIEEEVIG